MKPSTRRLGPDVADTKTSRAGRLATGGAFAAGSRCSTLTQSSVVGGSLTRVLQDRRLRARADLLDHRVRSSFLDDSFIRADVLRVDEEAGREPAHRLVDLRRDGDARVAV